MFVKEDDSVEEENTVAEFKRSVDGETLSKQQRMQNDIEAYNKTQVKQKISVRMNPTSRSLERLRKEQKGWKEVCVQGSNR